MTAKNICLSQLPVPPQCWKMIENINILFPYDKLKTPYLIIMLTDLRYCINEYYYSAPQTKDLTPLISRGAWLSYLT